jgi:hypothetical protein
VQTGFGGMAPRPAPDLRLWLILGLSGLLAASAGVTLATRRRRPALHARQQITSV